MKFDKPKPEFIGAFYGVWAVHVFYEGMDVTDGIPTILRRLVGGWYDGKGNPVDTRDYVFGDLVYYPEIEP